MYLQSLKNKICSRSVWDELEKHFNFYYPVAGMISRLPRTLLFFKAGIASWDCPERLLIALEPEAASIFCRKMRIRDCIIEDDLRQRSQNDSLISEDFEGLWMKLLTLYFLHVFQQV